MNQGQYIKETVEKLQELKTVLEAGLPITSGDLTDIKTNTSDTATNTADTVNNTAILADCVDQINNHIEVDTNAINGVTMAVSSGNLNTGTQRMCIATDDFNVSSIKSTNENIKDNTFELFNCIDHINLRVRIDQEAIGTVATAVNSGSLSNGTQRMCIASDDLNIADLLHIERPISGSYTNTKYFIIGGGYHPNVNTDYDFISPKMSSLTDDISSLGYVIPPALSVCYAISSDAGDNGKNVTLKYWDNTGAYQTATGNLIGTDKAADYLSLGSNVRMVDEFYMTSASNAGDVFLYQPTTITGLGNHFYTMFIPVGDRRAYPNLCGGLPLNSRCRLGMFNARASAEICKATVWRVEYDSPSTFSYFKLFESMISSFNPLINLDLNYLGYITGPTSSTNYVAIVCTSRAIGATPSYNSVSLSLKVDF